MCKKQDECRELRIFRGLGGALEGNRLHTQHPLLGDKQVGLRVRLHVLFSLIAIAAERDALFDL
jgi:hypothetical protein